MAVELHAAGVPLSAISCHLRELRGQVEHIAARFLEFTTEHVFARYLGGPHLRTDAGAAEAASLVRRLRPLAQHTVDAELVGAIRLLAVRQLRRHLGSREERETGDRTRPVAIPADTMSRVEALVGAGQAAGFVASAAERELRARSLDRMAAIHQVSNDVDETP